MKKYLHIHPRVFPVYLIAGIACAFFIASLDHEVSFQQCFEEPSCWLHLLWSMPFLGFMFAYPSNCVYNYWAINSNPTEKNEKISLAISALLLSVVLLAAFIMIGGLLLLIPLTAIGIPSLIVFEWMAYRQKQKWVQ